MIVVSDTTPLNYLILIDRVDILHALYERVVIPPAVLLEMQQSGTPVSVIDWTRHMPDWIIVESVRSTIIQDQIEEGEAEAISLAEQLHADLILLDDKVARRFAQARGLRIVGTLGVLAEASKRGLIDLGPALGDLKRTNFRFSEQLLDALLEQLGEPEA